MTLKHVRRIGKSKGKSKKSILRFINKKHCICTLVSRRKLKSFNSESIGLHYVKLYFNEYNNTISEYNNTLAFYGHKLKPTGLINSRSRYNSVVVSEL